MAAKFTCKILSPETTLFDGEAEMLSLRTTEGEVAFLAGHERFIGLIDKCSAHISVDSTSADGQGLNIALSTGVIHFNDNTAVVISETAEIETGEDI